MGEQMNIAIPARKIGVVAVLGAAAVISSFFSIVLSIGTSPVMDPRDILVVCAGVLAGPAGGALVGLIAGLVGPDPLSEVTLFMVGGLATGLISRYCMKNRVWIPTAALGLGFGYITAGAVLMITSWYDAVAALAFRSLIMLNVCILVLYIIDSLDPRVFLWERQFEVDDSSG